VGTEGRQITDWLADSGAWVEAGLDRFLPPADAQPARLHGAMRYALFGGGKRVRPALLRSVAVALGGSEDDALLPAAALECVHTYSLVHDDLPSMDDDDLRRGRPTCHVAFDEATAILAGDALLTLAFELVARVRPPELAAELCRVLATAAGAAGMVGGQVIDLANARASDPSAALAAVADLHERKTASLFRAAAEMGALVAGADGRGRAGAAEFGRALGLAFQAVDDVLDETGDAATLGKTPGKDAALERQTLVAAVAGAPGSSRRRPGAPPPPSASGRASRPST